MFVSTYEKLKKIKEKLGLEDVKVVLDKGFDLEAIGEELVFKGDYVFVADMLFNLKLAKDFKEPLLFFAKVYAKDPLAVAMFSATVTPLIKAWSFFHAQRYVDRETLEEIVYERKIKTQRKVVEDIKVIQSREDLDFSGKKILEFLSLTELLTVYLLCSIFGIPYNKEAVPTTTFVFQKYYEYSFKTPSMRNLVFLLKEIQFPARVEVRDDHVEVLR